MAPLWLGFCLKSTFNWLQTKALAAAFRNNDVKRGPLESRHFWFDRRYRWPYGIIPYVLSAEYSPPDIEIILNAMKEWEATTCVRFVPRQITDVAYVEITPDDGTSSYCYSYVGRQGGRQLMKMFGECMRHGAMLHELGHVIGFNHEHQRYDRDNYILVHFDNINPGNFVIADLTNDSHILFSMI